MEIRTIAILSSTDDVADARLHRTANALSRAGFELSIHALGLSSDAPVGTKFIRAPGRKTFVGRLTRDLTLPWIVKADLLIVVAPDLLITTYFIAKLRNKILISDVHEDYLKLLKDRPWAKGIAGLIGRAVARWATQIAAKTAITVVADTQVPPIAANHRLVVRNFPDRSLLTQSGEPSLLPRALYIGDVRTSRGLRTMLDAAVLAPNWHFDIVGSVADGDVAWVHLWSISNEEAALRVTFHGKLPPASAWKFAQGAWVGLTLLEPTPAFVEAVPSKLYEYMAVGLATITTSLPRCAALIQESQSGVVADSAIVIADQLQSWEQNPTPLLAMRANALTWSAKNLDAAVEYEPLIKALKAITSIHKSS